MPFSINSKTVKKVARNLTEMHPRFVSLVRNAATQIPFREVKSDKEESIMPNTVIKRIGFEKERFTDKQAVEYLESLGFSDFTLKSNKTEFFIENDIDEEKVVKESEIAGPLAGSSFVVVKMSEEGATPGEKEEEVKKSLEESRKASQEEPTNKFDVWEAMFSSSESFSDIVAEADDGLPIGMYQLTEAMVTAVKNSYRNDNISNIDAVLADYGKAIKFVYELYSIFPKTEKEITMDTKDKDVNAAVDSTETVSEEKKEAPKEPEKAAEASTEKAEKRSSIEDKLDEFLTTVKGLVGRMDALEASRQEEAQLRKSVEEDAEEKDADSAHALSEYEREELKKDAEWRNKRTARILGRL